MTALLTLTELSKSFGPLRVTDDLSLTLAPGEALGIIGPNGAGKTTMFNLITGDVRPDRGRIVYDGRDITALTPAQRCRRGLGRSYQIPHPFIGMTVFENVLVGASFGGALSDQEASDVAVRVLETTGFLDKANRLAGALTLLDRKRLELARALASGPRVLLLDEIAGGLTDHEVHELVDLINQVRRDGVAVIWIEHVVHALLAVVDRLAVINFGRLLMEGDPQTVMNSPEVREIYMGIDVA